MNKGCNPIWYNCRGLQSVDLHHKKQNEGSNQGYFQNQFLLVVLMVDLELDRSLNRCYCLQ